MEQALLHWIAHYGYAGIFLLLMFGIIGVPIPDETLLIFSGYLAFKGQLHIVPTIVSAFLGSICGITVSYGLGRIGGYALILRYGHWVHITEERIGQAREWLEHRGRWGLFIGYFIPGVRHLTALVAGTSRMRYSVFATFAYAGGLVWSTSFITAGFFLETGWRKVASSVRQWSLIAFVIVACILLLYYLLNRKARRTNPEETKDPSLGFGKDKGTNYNEKFLEFIKAFSNIGADTRLFPKTCHTCGRVYRSFPEYIHNTQPTSHCLEEYGSDVDATFTMQYRNCRCGSTLTIAFTKEIYPLLDRFWEMLGRESKETGKPLREVVAEFREQCNRYVIEHEKVCSTEGLPATADPHARLS